MAGEDKKPDATKAKTAASAFIGAGKDLVSLLGGINSVSGETLAPNKLSAK